MTDDTSIPDAWYHFAARAPGFLGDTLRIHHEHTGLSQQQQRPLLRLQDISSDALWLRLQAIPLPRPEHFDADLHRIVAHVLQSSPLISIPLAHLATFLHIGLDT